jgi:hypothetical protein
VKFDKPKGPLFKQSLQSGNRPKLDVPANAERMVVKVPLVCEREGKIFQETMVGRGYNHDATGSQSLRRRLHELAGIEEVLHNLETNRDIESTTPIVGKRFANSQPTDIHISDPPGEVKTNLIGLHCRNTPPL